MCLSRAYHDVHDDDVHGEDEGRVENQSGFASLQEFTVGKEQIVEVVFAREHRQRFRNRVEDRGELRLLVYEQHVEGNDVSDPDEHVDETELEKGEKDADEEKAVFANLQGVHEHEQEQRPDARHAQSAGFPLPFATEAGALTADVEVHGEENGAGVGVQFEEVHEEAAKVFLTLRYQLNEFFQQGDTGTEQE